MKMTMGRLLAMTICEMTSGGEGKAGIHACECKHNGQTCPDMLKAADAALAAIDCAEFGETQVTVVEPGSTNDGVLLARSIRMN